MNKQMGTDRNNITLTEIRKKVMRSLFLASTSWLENVCYLAKEIINAKIV